jgi:hypothetical protein
MILNTTHIDKEKKDLINKLVGHPLSLWESLFQNKGSHRMIIESFSEKFNKFFKTYNNLLYANIEIRKKGIIIRISINNETVSWLVPFYKLTIYNSSLFSIYSNGNNIKFRKDRYYKINKNFINSLIEQKAVHSEKFDIS